MINNHNYYNEYRLNLIETFKKIDKDDMSKICLWLRENDATFFSGCLRKFSIFKNKETVEKFLGFFNERPNLKKIMNDLLVILSGFCRLAGECLKDEHWDEQKQKYTGYEWNNECRTRFVSAFRDARELIRYDLIARVDVIFRIPPYWEKCKALEVNYKMYGRFMLCYLEILRSFFGVCCVFDKIVKRGNYNELSN